jgi:hypothetical protein
LEKFSADPVGEYRFRGISECSSPRREFWSIGTLITGGEANERLTQVLTLKTS